MASEQPRPANAQDSEQVRLRARIALLEAALADYAARYGLTEMARVLLVAPGTEPDPSEPVQTSGSL